MTVLYMRDGLPRWLSIGKGCAIKIKQSVFPINKIDKYQIKRKIKINRKRSNR